MFGSMLVLRIINNIKIEVIKVLMKEGLIVVMGIIRWGK